MCNDGLHRTGKINQIVNNWGQQAQNKHDSNDFEENKKALVEIQVSRKKKKKQKRKKK